MKTETKIAIYQRMMKNLRNKKWVLEMTDEEFMEEKINLVEAIMRLNI